MNITFSLYAAASGGSALWSESQSVAVTRGTYNVTLGQSVPLTASLFVQPSYNHYVFGDYYDRSFLSVGIFPWFSFTYASGPRPVLALIVSR